MTDCQERESLILTQKEHSKMTSPNYRGGFKTFCDTTQKKVQVKELFLHPRGVGSIFHDIINLWNKLIAIIFIFSGCREAVLRVKEVRHCRGVRTRDLWQHAPLPLPLVRGLEVCRVLPG